jgi:hypothetical protein
VSGATIDLDSAAPLRPAAAVGCRQPSGSSVTDGCGAVAQPPRPGTGAGSRAGRRRRAAGQERWAAGHGGHDGPEVPVLTPGLLGPGPGTPRLASGTPRPSTCASCRSGPAGTWSASRTPTGKLWAIKELPDRVASKEYSVLRQLEAKGCRRCGRRAGLPAARTATPCWSPATWTPSWQFRRLLMRLPPNRPRHRARLLDAMASLLVDLHRNGVYWGDCSLANTLFSRDGQRLQAWLVDAETSEIHPELTDGQRRYDLDILVENVAGGLMDLAMMLDRPGRDPRAAHRGGGRRRAALPRAVGRAARGAAVQLRRAARGRGADPPAQRPGLRRRRDQPRADRRRGRPAAAQGGRWRPASSTPPSCSS